MAARRRARVCGGLVAAVLALATGAKAIVRAAPVAASWTTFGNTAQRTGGTVPAPTSLQRSFVLPVDGRITGQVLASRGVFYAATTSGEVVAFNANGFVLWRDDLGQLAQTCPQLDGYGIVGTGVIDAAAHLLYVADAFGRLHALALGTGAERGGWPVRVFTDFRKELVWGALTLAGGSVFVPTASYCDTPSVGGIHRVDVRTQQVATWLGVPEDEGGGGGVWGWGGAAYSPHDAALFAVTANAFPGGTNSGDNFSESAGYGEHLVELASDLTVEASSHPSDITDGVDLDFVGSPVVFSRAGCGELVVAADKDDQVYAWRANDVTAGPIWQLRLQPYDPENPLLSQLAWSSKLSSLYAVTGTQLVRIAIGPTCSARIAWTRQLGTHTENGSPTIAGKTVWFALNGTPRLVGYDGQSGKRVFSAPLGGETVEAPTVTGNRLVVGTMSGFVEGFSFGRVVPAAVKAHYTATWAGARYGWQTRPTGVYATENGGRSWRLILAGTPLAALRLSRTSGIASIASGPGRCMCATRQFFTTNDGASWHPTSALGSRFTLGGGHVFFWTGGTLRMLAPLTLRSTARLSSTTVATLGDGTISDVEAIPGGVVALVSSRVNGEGWDTDPRVVLVHGRTAQTVMLPMERGRILVEKVEVAWPTLTVVGTDYVANPVRSATWVSDDGGTMWTTATSAPT